MTSLKVKFKFSEIDFRNRNNTINLDNVSTIHCQNFRGFGVEQLSKESCIIQWWKGFSAKSAKHLVLRREPHIQNKYNSSEFLNDSRQYIETSNRIQCAHLYKSY